MKDIPKISQLSIIAFCNCGGEYPTTTPRWRENVKLRAPLEVSALTAVTLKVNGGSTAIISPGAHDEQGTAGIRVRVVGGSIAVDAYYYNTLYRYQTYGYYDSATFTLTAVTAGDPARGIEGATREWTIPVLMLGRDWPWAEPAFSALRVGRRYYWHFRHEGAARMWQEQKPDGANNPLVGDRKIDGEHPASGLQFHAIDSTGGDRAETYIDGIAERPGLYRFVMDGTTKNAESTDPEQYEDSPFPGGGGTTVVTVCVYAPYQPGNTVIVFPADVPQLPQDALAVANVPDLGPTGYGEYLQQVGFAHDTDNELWWAVYDVRGSAAAGIILRWYFRALLRSGAWRFEMFRIEPTDYDPLDPPPDLGLPGPTQLATLTMDEILGTYRAEGDFLAAAARGFDDEQPPKQGWRQAGASKDLYFTGDRLLYVPPEKNAVAGGWYNYAGTVEYVPEGAAEPVAVPVYERNAHYMPDTRGWHYNSIIGVGEYYLAAAGGRWYSTANAAALHNLPAVSGMTAVEVMSAQGGIALPYCPGKTGDVGMVIKNDGYGVFHSLANQFPRGDDFRVVMENLAGAQWMYYPMRRLIDLASLNPTVTMTLRRTYRGSSDYYGGDNGAERRVWHCSSIPDMEAAGSWDTSEGTSEVMETRTGATEYYAQCDVTIPLAYFVLDGERLIQEMWGRPTAAGTVTGKLTRRETYNGYSRSSEKLYHRYAVPRPGGEPGQLDYVLYHTGDIHHSTTRSGTLAAETETIHDPSAWSTARLFWGEGRDSDDAHRQVTAAVEMGHEFGGTLKLSGQSMTMHVTVDELPYARRERGWTDPETSWDDAAYSGSTPSGNPITAENWDTRYSYSEDWPYSIGGEQHTVTEGMHTTSGLAKFMLAALYSGSFSGVVETSHEEKSSSFAYQTQEDGVTVDHAGARDKEYRKVAGFDDVDTTTDSGDNIDNITLERSLPGNYEGAFGSITDEYTSLRFEFRVDFARD